jgi:hypothetical protein
MKLKPNSYQSFLLVGMLDHVLKILYRGSMKDQSITFNLPVKNYNNSLRQRSTLLVNTMRLLRPKQCLSMHGMKIAKMVLLLFLLSETALCTLILYRRYFHRIVNQTLSLYIHWSFQAKRGILTFHLTFVSYKDDFSNEIFLS